MSANRELSSSAVEPAKLENQNDMSHNNSSETMQDAYSKFPPLAAQFMRRKQMFYFNPEDASAEKDITPGLYSFIQQKEHPRTIFLMYTKQYQSIHSHQVSLLKFKPSKEFLLSAGEMVIGAKGRVAAWSLRTGHLFDVLGLDNFEIESPLMREIGLPADCFYDVKLWINFQEASHSFEDFFKFAVGELDIINLSPKSSLEYQKLQTLQNARHEKESAHSVKMSGDTAKLYRSLQLERDQYEKARLVKLSPCAAWYDGPLSPRKTEEKKAQAMNAHQVSRHLWIPSVSAWFQPSKADKNSGQGDKSPSRYCGGESKVKL